MQKDAEDLYDWSPVLSIFFAPPGCISSAIPETSAWVPDHLSSPTRRGGLERTRGPEEWRISLQRIISALPYWLRSLRESIRCGKDPDLLYLSKISTSWNYYSPIQTAFGSLSVDFSAVLWDIVLWTFISHRLFTVYTYLFLLDSLTIWDLSLSLGIPVDTSQDLKLGCIYHQFFSLGSLCSALGQCTVDFYLPYNIYCVYLFIIIIFFFVFTYYMRFEAHHLAHF